MRWRSPHARTRLRARRPVQDLWDHRRGGPRRPGRAAGFLLRPGRPERRRQDDEPVDGRWAPPSRCGHRPCARRRCLGVAGPRQGDAGRAPGWPDAAGAADRPGAPDVSRTVAEHAGRRSGGAQRRAPRCPWPRLGRRDARHRVLVRHAEEDRARRRAAPRAEGARARRAVRECGSGVRIDDPDHPPAVRRRRQHGRVLKSRDGPRRAPVLACGRDRGRSRASRRNTRRRATGTIDSRTLHRPGGAEIGGAEGLAWLAS